MKPHELLAQKLDEKLAAHLGVGSNIVACWRNGMQKIPAARAQAIAEFLGIDAEAFRQTILEAAYPELFAGKNAGKRLEFVSANEMEFLQIIRSTPAVAPCMNEEQKASFKRFVESLSDEGDAKEASN